MEAYLLLFSLVRYVQRPEMIPTPKCSPTLKWSPNRPRNDTDPKMIPISLHVDPEMIPI